MEIDFQEILRIIGPGSGRDIIWSVFLYVIFFFALFTLFTIPDKNMVPTLLMASVLLFAIVAKLSLSTRPPLLARKEFGMMVINVGMFIFPLISAGLVRARKNRTGAPAIITALIAGTYFFIFWLLEQRI